MVGAGHVTWNNVAPLDTEPIYWPFADIVFHYSCLHKTKLFLLNCGS